MSGGWTTSKPKKDLFNSVAATALDHTGKNTVINWHWKWEWIGKEQKWCSTSQVNTIILFKHSC